VGLVGRLRSPDGVWHVEVWEQRGRQRYRLLRLGGLYAEDESLAKVRRILHDQGEVDWADLVED
jgi:hypothetical protein